MNENADPAIRFFSGEASYSSQFHIRKGSAAGKPVWLDLGEVGDLAEVVVNGQKMGGVWHAPYRLNIGPAVKRGVNNVEIKVVNRWVNRLIGDAQPNAKPITWTAMPTYRADAPLRRSGLIGPVTIQVERPGR